MKRFRLWPFRRRDIDRDLREEIAFHIDMRAELNRNAGTPESAAMNSARRRFGNSTLVQEEARRMHVSMFFETLLQDLRYAFRGLAHNPTFTITAIVAAALGIAGATAVFSVVDRILFRPLPYPHDDRLVSVGVMAPLDNNEFMVADGYFDLRRDHPGLQSITSFVAGTVDCDLEEANAARPNPVRLGCTQVEGNFLDVLGRPPLLGRNFTAQEDKPNAPRVALITYALWRGRFGSDPAISGHVVWLDGQPLTIIGVLPEDFEMPTLSKPDLLLASQLNEATERAGRILRVFGRLQPGVTVAQVHDALAPSFARMIEQTVPAAFRKEVHLRVRTLRDRQIQEARGASWILLAAVISVLLIACANIANLLLARSMARQKELAVRAALGAGRWRLMRQMLTESVLLGVFGGIAGCGGAWLLLRLFIRIAPSGILRLEQARLDIRVLLFAIAVSLASGILFGFAPALRLPRPEALTGRRVAGASRGLLRECLVAAQIAVSLLLLTGAGMLLDSLWRLETAPLGIETNHIVTAEFTLSRERYGDNARQLQFYNNLASRLPSIPGAGAAAITDSLPPYGASRNRLFASIQVEGRPPFSKGTGGMVLWRYVSPGYFATVGVPILKGRAFSAEDTTAPMQAIILNATLAKRLFPNGDAVGRRIKTEAWDTIVGVAADVHDLGPSKTPEPAFYMVRRRLDDEVFRNQMAGYGWRHAFVVARTPVNPRIVAEWIRAQIAEIDPEMPVTFGSMEQRVGTLTQAPRFNAFLLTLFAGVGLLLAVIGLYGVMSFLIAQRTQEIGVRMALGATPATIARLILSRAATWVLAGAAVGLIASLFAGRLLRTVLVGSTERDPAVYAVVLVLLLAIAFAAAWIPSRRATRIQPVIALRHE